MCCFRLFIVYSNKFFPFIIGDINSGSSICSQVPSITCPFGEDNLHS